MATGFLFQVFCVPFLLLFLCSLAIVTGSETEVKVKRILSRQRRFIAPGANWQILTGISIFRPESQLVFDLVHSYPLDYLFGGNAAFLAAVRAAEAAAKAEAAAQAAVLAAAAATAAQDRLGYNLLPTSVQKTTALVAALGSELLAWLVQQEQS